MTLLKWSKQQAASSKQQAASSKQQAASSKQQAASSKQQAASSKQASSTLALHRGEGKYLGCTPQAGVSLCSVTYCWVMLWLQKVLQTKLCRLIFEEQQPAQKGCCGEEGQELDQQAGNKQYSNLQGLAALCRE